MLFGWLGADKVKVEWLLNSVLLLLQISVLLRTRNFLFCSLFLVRGNDKGWRAWVRWSAVWIPTWLFPLRLCVVSYSTSVPWLEGLFLFCEESSWILISVWLKNLPAALLLKSQLCCSLSWLQFLSTTWMPHILEENNDPLTQFSFLHALHHWEFSEFCHFTNAGEMLVRWEGRGLCGSDLLQNFQSLSLATDSWRYYNN